MSSRCALRITEQGEAGPPAFTALLGREGVVAALGEHRCARSRAFEWRVRRCTRSRTWGACGAPLRPRFGLICLEPTSMHPPCCVKRVHERHESPFFGQILTLVYTFWVRRCVGSNLSLVAEKSPHPKGTQARHSLWRRERDSNPRDAINAYTISNRAPSTNSAISPW